jgi:hypothetical protein
MNVAIAAGASFGGGRFKVIDQDGRFVCIVWILLRIFAGVNLLNANLNEAFDV